MGQYVNLARSLKRIEQQIEAYQRLHADELAELWHALDECKNRLAALASSAVQDSSSEPLGQNWPSPPELYGSRPQWAQTMISKEDQKTLTATDKSQKAYYTRYRMGVDIGGTFTDFVVVDDTSGRMTVEKTPSTPGNFWLGIEEGLGKLDLGLEVMDMIVHGTTIGLNALLERRGRPTGLITTHAFRDIYEIARHNRTETYDLFYLKPVPLIPRRYRLEVRERVDPFGVIVQPLVEDDVLECVRTFKAAGIDAIAVCLLHSYANPDHERRVGEILAREYPEASVSLSHEIVRQWREYERTSTTAINAYIMSLVGDYLGQIDSSLAARGYTRPFFVSQSSGGIMSVKAAKRKPVHTIMSGPAGGAMASMYIGGLSGHANVITFDMGGTSTDVSLIHEGALRVTAESEIDRYPLMVSMIDLKSIGAGGGSIAWLDTAGALNVGPQSSGADPGPVCYGKGGKQPTVTDANLVLGRLHPDHFLGGEIPLYAEPARQQIEAQIAHPLNLGLTEAANGIIEVINTKMAYAVRAITIERGLDPKDFALLAFGGAGPMHACAIARQLGIPEIIVPSGPGAFSAMGMLVSDVRHDFVRTFPVVTDDGQALVSVNVKFHEMIDEAAGVLEQEGTPRSLMEFRRLVDMRYSGQEYTISIPLSKETLDADHLAELRAHFHTLHERNYGHSSPTEPTEIVNLRVVAIGRVAKPQLGMIETGSRQPTPGARLGEIDTYFPTARASVRTQLYNREELLAGNRIRGPAIVIEKTATTVVEPGFELEVMPQGHLSLRQER